MYILGINAYHGDSSACLYLDGKLIAATEEERIRRVKHWAGLPSEAVKFCLEFEGISLSDVDIICISKNPTAKFIHKAKFVIRNNLDFRNIKNRVNNIQGVRTIKSDLKKALGVEKAIKAEIKFLEHHRCHLASAFYISPFEKSALLSIDGMGDFTSTMRGIGRGNKIQVLDTVTFPHSLGYFYTSFTQYLGFPNYGDEYKMMGLSPYGSPNKEIENKIWDYIQLRKNGLFKLNLKYLRNANRGDWMSIDEKGRPLIKPMFNDYFIKQFGPARQKGEPITQYHKDLAASVQNVTEEVIYHMAEDLYRKTKIKSLCIAGGVGQNSVANGKIVENTSFENLFVPPASHDAGTSAGSALLYYHQKLNNPRHPFKVQPYTGVKFSNEKIEDYLKVEKVNYSKYEDEQLMEVVTNQLLNGGVVGWFQGQSEFGPRALGNRSIIVDPRREDAKELLNEKIKRRESFRPFAPSILKEAVQDYFEQIEDVPFMEKVFRIKKDKHKIIPAVTHVDGTGRLQTVEKNVNPRYYHLIKTFANKTGVPILLNTSFNENEPIVDTPTHAFACFFRTKMDMLVLENCVITRNKL